MIGDLSITQRAFQQSSNSVEAQVIEARLGLAAATAAGMGKDVAAGLGDPADAPPLGSQRPAPASLMVKVLDKKA